MGNNNKKFQVTVDFLGNIEDIKAKTGQLNSLFSNLGKSSSASSIQKKFDDLSSTISALQSKAREPIGSQAEFNKLASSVDRTKSAYADLAAKVEGLRRLSDSKKLELLPPDQQRKIESATRALDNYEDSAADAARKAREYAREQSRLAEQMGIQKSAIDSIDEYTTKIEEAEAAIRKLRAEQAKNQEELVSKRRTRDTLGGQLRAAEKRGDEAAVADLKPKYEAAKQEVDRLVAAQRQLGVEITDATKGQDRFQKSLDAARKDADKAAEAIKLIQANMKGDGTAELKAAFDELKAKAQELGVSLEGISGVQSIDELLRRMKQLGGEGVEQANKVIEELAERLGSQLDPEMRRLGENLDANRRRFEQFNQRAKEVQSLKERIKYFFSLTNSIMLFRRAITDALNSVKELDATMTEAAVVTDFSVGDMWDKLPQYTREAQKLGVSINGMYEATTLYYQQGLKSNEAMAVGIETMKMAKIAGMDSADATKAMTAALRGFNMEINETSATRVNDVYSQLAAVTAADTNQIATAMEKTASIAASANMEFETTAALLAQIIETTQEAPETAGTAMKTIIARFSEVKQLRDQGMSSGTDEEGELIDVNKIQTALKSIGISMDKFFAGEEGLDQVLLKLAEKWDTLDFETQRYIATMAAGSRQQSRFIAMMSNYERTTELVGEAYDSTGASQRQYEKTLESMESKLQKLENAWNELLMSFANNEALKFAVDSLTKILESINGMTESLSGGNGLIRAVIALATAISAFKVGGNVLGKGLGWVGKQMGLNPQGNEDNETNEGASGKGEQAGSMWANGFRKGLGNLWEKIIGPGLEPRVKDLGSFEDFAKKISNQLDKNRVTIPVKPDPEEFTGKGKKKRYQAAMEKYKLDRKQYDKWLSENPEAKLEAANQRYVETGNLEELKKAYAEAGYEIEEVNGKLRVLSQVSNDAASNAHKVGHAMSAIGGAAMTAGAACMGLAAVFSAAGWDEGAEAMSTIGQVVMSVGVAFNSLGGIIQAVAAKIAVSGWVAILPWLAIAIAVAAVVAIVMIAINNSETMAEKIEKLNKQVEAFEAAAEEAAEKLEEINETRAELEKIQDTFKNLTKGSIEWKKALIENNRQVLDLINKYSILQTNTEFLGYGANGEMIITDAGWQAILNQQTQAQMVAQMGAIATQHQLLGIQYQDKILDIAAEGMGAYNAATFGGNQITHTKSARAYLENDSEFLELGGINPQLLAKIAQAAVSRNLDLTDENVLGGLAAEFGVEVGKLKTAMKVLGSSFYELGNEANALQMAQSQAVRTMVQTSVKGMGVNAGVVEDVVTDMYDDDYAAELEKKKAEYGNYDSVYGSNGDVKKKRLDDYSGMINEYAQLINSNQADVLQKIQNKELTMEQIATALAQNKLSGEIDDAAKALNAWINALDVSKKALVKGLFTKEGLGLTAKQIEEIKGKNGWIDPNSGQMTQIGAEEFLREYLGIAEGDDAAAQAAGFTDYATAVAMVTKNFNQGAAAMDNAYAQAANFWSEGAEGVKKAIAIAFGDIELTVGQTQGLANALADVARNGGNATELLTKLGSLVKGVDEDDLPQVMELIGSTDWTSQGSVDSTLGALELLGVEINDKLRAEIYLLANTIKDVSMDSLIAKLQKFASVVETVSEKVDSGSRVFTYEERNALIEAGIDSGNFAMTGYDSWVYLGDITALLTQLRNLSSKIYSEMIGDINKRVQKGRQIGEQKNKNYVEVGGERIELKTKEGELLTQEQLIKGIQDGTITEDVLIEMLGGQNKDPELARKIITAIITGMGLGEEETLGSFTLSGLMELLGQGYRTYYGSEEEQASREDEAKTEQNNMQVGEAATQLKQGAIIIGPDGQATEIQTRAMEAVMMENSELAGFVYDFEERLKKTNPELAKNENLLRNYAIAAYYAAKKMDGLNQKIKDNAEALAGDGAEAWTAAEEIAKYLGGLFGTEITAQWVMSNKELILAMTKGGEEAKEAWKKILKDMFNKNLTKKILESGLLGLDFQAAGGIVNEIMNKFNPGDNGQITIGANLDVNTEAWQKFLSWLNEIGITISVASQDDDSTVLDVSVSDTSGLANLFGPGSGGGGGSSKYKNPHDKQYNTYEKVNALLRERNKIEREYDRLLQSRNVSGKKLLENSRQQIANLEQEKEYQQYLADKKHQEVLDYISANSKYSKYAGINKDGTIWIDWDAINAITNSDKGGKVDDFISTIESLRDQWWEAEDTLDEIEDSVNEIRKQGEESYLSAEQLVADAYIQSRQEEIDKLSEINDSINDTNSRLLDKIQSQIDEARQERDNKKTEEEIADKQRRLAYLQMDTSGANAMEILQLQKEIDEAQEDYTDTLIDQKISELQKQNDEAAEQRERQIELLQNQLDWEVESGRIWNKVHEIWKNGISDDGVIIEGGSLDTLLKNAAGFWGMSANAQEKWAQETGAQFAEAYAGLHKMTPEKDEVVSFSAGGKTLKGTSLGNGNVQVGDTVYFGVHKDMNGNYVTSDTVGTTKKESSSSGRASGKLASLPGKVGLSNADVRSLQAGLNDLLDDKVLGGFSKLAVDGIYGTKTAAAVRILQKALGVGADGVWGPETQRAFASSSLRAYRSGGLADFTGPAWLDGTKSKPEYVLNAEQTKAFFTLVDVLSGFVGGSSNTAENSGDNTYDIDINVESIGSDYDVEQLANKIRGLINEDARYRNNNTINLMR